jgi:hypothetical protein
LLDGVDVLVITFEPWHSDFACDARRLRELGRLDLDPYVYVDNGGLHVRWAGGRGGMNLRQTLPAPTDKAKTRYVAIPLEARLTATMGPSIAKAEIRRAS